MWQRHERHPSPAILNMPPRAADMRVAGGDGRLHRHRLCAVMNSLFCAFKNRYHWPSSCMYMSSSAHAESLAELTIAAQKEQGGHSGTIRLHFQQFDPAS